ncbi:MAG: prolyl oligopeptidase family serine peptidase, partial [Bdellovibrionota bacterium]
GRVLKDTLKDASGSFAWVDDTTFYYVVADENLRPYRVFRHILGENPKKDRLVYEEKDKKQFLGLSHSSSEQYLFVYSAGKVTTEVWYLPVSDPLGKLECFEPRKEGIEYFVDHRAGDFWILTNWKAPNFQIMKTSLTETARRHWKPFVKNSKASLRTNILLFRDYMVVTETTAGLPQISVYEFAKKKWHSVKFKDPVYSVAPGGSVREFDTNVLRLHYSSPVQPDTVYDYDMSKRRLKQLKVQPVKGHSPSKYRCERVFVKGHDGTKVPLTLLYRKGTKRNGKAPGYLYGYGSYGASMPAGFPARRDVYRLVDRGFVYALAHPRGGEEMGRQWYLNGKFLKKKNTFKDFIACAEYLIDEKWVRPGQLATCGGSAGGMLMGAVMNMRPDLFGAVIAHVPFVDVLNTMLDKDLPLTQLEYKEWGNPAEAKFYKYIKSYSPYDNVARKTYPPLMVTCGLNDPRVTYWEPAKWVAKLRELKKGDHPIVFKTNMGAGHFGQSGRFQHLEEQAEEFAFILKTFGLVG